MKGIIKTLLVGLGLISIFSCTMIREVDYGFPKTVKFSNEGGEKIVKGDEGRCYGAEIYDPKGNKSQYDSGVYEDDIKYFQYEWLKVEYKLTYHNTTNEIKIIAEPNHSGKTRQLDILLYGGTDRQTIEVIQD